MAKATQKALLLLMGLALIASGCAGSGNDVEGFSAGKPDDTGSVQDKLADGKADAWNTRNNPDGLRVEMTKTLADLPINGETENAAWPDTYWPTYKDSVNARWQRTSDYLEDLSPAEKYDVAFNGWDPESVRNLRPFDGSNCAADSFDPTYYENLGPAAKFVSDNKGNKDTRTAILNGELDDRCNAKPEGDCIKACEGRDNQSRCENRCDRGGVETWWGLCHAWAPAAILEKEPLHPVTIPTEYGEVTFQVGDMKALHAVIYDRSRAALIGGRCNEFEVERDETTGRITSSQCRDLNAGAFHVSMTNLIGIQKRGFVEDRTFDYEVWNQPVKGYDSSAPEEITTAEAHELLGVNIENPTDCISSANLANGDYCYNTDIDTLYKVSTTLHWITESHASVIAEGHENLARYSRTDRYTYILEVKDGEIVGGEWYGASQNDHPDFIWLPFRAGSGNQFVEIEKVKMLGRMSQTAPGATTGPTEDIITATSGDVNIAIPDKDPAGISSVINVGDGVNVNVAKVDVDITHSYIGDLIVTLEGPSGQSFELQRKQGGSQDDIKKTFTIENVGAINGAWTLKVSDHYSRDVGTLNSWKLNFLVGGEENPNSAVSSFDSTIVADIPDSDSGGVSSYIDVDANGSIKGLQVSVNITHTYVGDLQVTLKKGGVTKVLHNREGGSDDNLNKTYNVDEFNGQEASGRWYLNVSDNAGQDIGTRDGWSIKITH
jgi:subtilisin-like proprotein convertase family protein